MMDQPRPRTEPDHSKTGIEAAGICHAINLMVDNSARIHGLNRDDLVAKILSNLWGPRP